ncbi:hypothetical protein TraAM80_09968 [Trypanosoma rangeli]|uniref:Uncharacterized protein n=1 Tax=Trypanosoma rangeli TaxID=5698 RepID=A0A3R7K9P2_TRYRA|nr:uncharacterized protein TraAM80_09968 [Trypanosoma rangeli]RNE96374.1 hypothetical protein TraAM80_09968 [Trypanosoma rangeli]|eukprot:RNE96374.1 hypothetical protein TraAM80_09968 [Trypanosoma rangeli]
MFRRSGDGLYVSSVIGIAGRDAVLLLLAYGRAFYAVIGTTFRKPTAQFALQRRAAMDWGTHGRRGAVLRLPGPRRLCVSHGGHCAAHVAAGSRHLGSVPGLYFVCRVVLGVELTSRRGALLQCGCGESARGRGRQDARQAYLQLQLVPDRSGELTDGTGRMTAAPRQCDTNVPIAEGAGKGSGSACLVPCTPSWKILIDFVVLCLL